MQHFLDLRTLAASLLVCATLVGCANVPELATEPGLAPFASRSFDTVLADPERQEPPRRVHVGELVVEGVEIRQPEHRGSAPGREWALEEDEVVYIERLWTEAFTAAIEAHPGLELAGGPGEGVNVVSGRLLELAPTAPKDDLRSRAGVRTIVTRGAGQVTLRLDVHDEDGLRAALVDRRRAGTVARRNDRFHNRAEFRRLLGSWTQDVAELIAVLPSVSSRPG